MRWFRKHATESPPSPNTSGGIHCPRCGLLNPATSLWCDCGHVFDLEHAREVIADQLHSHVDRPLGGVLFCPLCTRLSPKDTQLCFCGYRFRLPPSDTDTVPVKCPSCAARLWLRPPIDGAHFICSKCSKSFSAVVSEQGEVQLEVVDFFTDLEACYAILGLTTSATQDQVRRAYEQRVAEYDLSTLPQVARELRDMAAAGQRRLRAAYISLARLSAQAS